jgi:hypothetical protein
MRNGILRDVVFACAGVFVVTAAIGLPRPAAATQSQWSVQSRCETKGPGQGTELLPCYLPKGPPPGQGQFFPKPGPPPPPAQPAMQLATAHSRRGEGIAS